MTDVDCSSQQLNTFLNDNFTILIVMSYLSDKDAVQSLLICGKELKPAFDNYSIKSSMNASKINDLLNPNSDIKYRIVAVKEMQIDQLILLPQSVRKLSFDTNFNQPLAVGVLPSLVTHLTFGNCFNQSLYVGVLPSSMTHLIFGWDFDQSLEVEVLPSSLTHLIFGVKFNHPIEVGVLPSSLTHLTFGCYFNQPLQVGVLIDTSDF